MKKFIFLIATLLLISCSSKPVIVSNSAKETTVEILQAVNDTITYNLVILEDPDVYYAVNTETKQVEYKFVNRSGITNSILTIMVVIIIFLLTITILLKN